jgi:cyclophilin family peptidyl-prolyl cis-trans isomerase
MWGLSVFLTLPLANAYFLHQTEEFVADYMKKPGAEETSSGLMYRYLEKGPMHGDPEAPYQTMDSYVKVDYVVRLIDGTEIDSSYREGRPECFQPKHVIAGWSEAMLTLMTEGDMLELVIPPELAYGPRGRGDVIPRDIGYLVFEIKMVKANVSKYERSFDAIYYTDFKNPYVWMVIGGFLYWFYYMWIVGTDDFDTKRVSPRYASDKRNPICWMEISIDGEVAGKVEFELFANYCPKICENFRGLCTGEYGIGKCYQKALHYKGSPFHKVIIGYLATGGDIVNSDGQGGESVHGLMFDDEYETGWVAHDEPYLLSMASKARNTNQSQFNITLTRTPNLNGQRICFGRVISGVAVVKKVSQLGNTSGKLSKAVIISDCGGPPEKVERVPLPIPKKNKKI